MQLSIPASAYVEIPNILGAYLQDENIGGKYKADLYQINSRLQTPITPVQRGEIIATITHKGKI